MPPTLLRRLDRTHPHGHAYDGRDPHQGVEELAILGGTLMLNCVLHVDGKSRIDCDVRESSWSHNPPNHCYPAKRASGTTTP